MKPDVEVIILRKEIVQLRAALEYAKNYISNDHVCKIQAIERIEQAEKGNS